MIPRCFCSLCILRLRFEETSPSHSSHLYLIFKCFISTCILRLCFVPAWYVHSLQLCFIPERLAFLWIPRFSFELQLCVVPKCFCSSCCSSDCFESVIWSHLVHGYCTSFCFCSLCATFWSGRNSSPRCLIAMCFFKCFFETVSPQILHVSLSGCSPICRLCMCFFKFFFVTVFPQIEQASCNWFLVLLRSVLWLTWICFFRSHFWLVLISYWSHCLSDLSPTCLISMCLFKFFFVNVFPQSVQVSCNWCLVLLLTAL